MERGSVHLFRSAMCEQHVEILAGRRLLLCCADGGIVIGKKEALPFFIALSWPSNLDNAAVLAAAMPTV